MHLFLELEIIYMQITRNFKEHAYFMCSPGKAYQNALSNLNDYQQDMKGEYVYNEVVWLKTERKSPWRSLESLLGKQPFGLQ